MNEEYGPALKRVISSPSTSRGENIASILRAADELMGYRYCYWAVSLVGGVGGVEFTFRAKLQALTLKLFYLEYTSLICNNTSLRRLIKQYKINIQSLMQSTNSP